MIIPFPPFEPDRGQFSTDVTNNVVNVRPTASGWGPMPGLTVVSDALPDGCRGAAYVITSTGTIRIVAATSTAIYELDTTTYTWTDISGTDGPYNLASTDYWSFTLFGTQLIIHNVADPIQVYDVTSGGTVATLAGSPPQARYSCVAGDYLVLGSLEGTSGERKIQTSGLNDATFWTIGKNGADYQELPEGNEIMGVFGDQGGFYVIQKSAMQFFSFNPGSGYTFTRTVVNPERGAVSPRSIVPVGPSQFYYLSEDGFMAGAERKPIGAERVDKWFLANVDMSYFTDIQGAADPFEKIVWWRFKTVNGPYARVGYDWQLDRWTYSDINVTEMTAMAKPGVTWDGLDDLYASIDAATEAFDSRLFLGGRPTFAAFDSSNRLGFFAGPNLAATVDTPLMQYAEDSRSFLRNVRVITDATGFSLQDGTAAFHGDDITWSTPSFPNARSKMCDFRKDGRLHRLRISVPAGTVWDNLNSCSADAIATGAV
jgi:hypothetical protein